jgi:hypothetical protein
VKAKIYYDYATMARRACKVAGVEVVSAEMRDYDLALTWQTDNGPRTFTWALMGYEDPKAIKRIVYEEISQASNVRHLG